MAFSRHRMQGQGNNRRAASAPHGLAASLHLSTMSAACIGCREAVDAARGAALQHMLEKQCTASQQRLCNANCAGISRSGPLTKWQGRGFMSHASCGMQTPVGSPLTSAPSPSRALGRCRWHRAAAAAACPAAAPLCTAHPHCRPRDQGAACRHYQSALHRILHRCSPSYARC